MTQTELPLLLTAAEISRKIIAVNARTLKRWQAAGKIEGHLINGKWRFNRESVLAYLLGSPPSPEPVIAPSAKRPGRPRKVSQEAGK
jgi:Helix-turn-helix domain